MKKIIITILVGIMVSFTLSCNNSAKYPYEHIGIYDTKIQQYIDIGDSKEKIDKFLGYSYKTEYDFYEYDDVLSISFDDNNNVDFISLDFFSSPNEDENERYTLSDNMSYTSTVTDFLNKYKYVYEYESCAGINEICVILQKTNKGIIQLSKDKILSMQKMNENSNKEIDDLYIVSVYYAAYDDISYFDVEKIAYPEIYNWEQLREIDK